MKAQINVENITHAQAKERLGQPGLVVVDVREPEEYHAGHIPGAILFPLSTIREASAAERILSKESPLLVYCRSGARSKRAAAMLSLLGYQKVADMGGLIGWDGPLE